MKNEIKKQHSPHQGRIDNIVNKYREKKDEQARKLEQNPNKLVSMAGTLQRQGLGNITDYKDDKITSQYIHRKLNDNSPTVQAAYAVDRAVTKSVNKIKSYCQKNR
jgi:cysteinyl-tRNA synthetase